MDWTNMQDWENLPETLKELGIELPEDQLKYFIDQCKDAAGAIDKVDMTTFIDDLKSLASAIKDLTSDEATRNISDKTYQEIIKYNPEMASQFSMNYDGSWDYMGDSIESLAEALRENTRTQLKNAETQLRTSLATSSIID
jgi:hypothetical protein